MYFFVFVFQAARWAGGPAEAAGGQQLSGWTSPQRGAGQDQRGAGEETSGDENNIRIIHFHTSTQSSNMLSQKSVKYLHLEQHPSDI